MNFKGKLDMQLQFSRILLDVQWGWTGSFSPVKSENKRNTGGTGFPGEVCPIQLKIIRMMEIG